MDAEIIAEEKDGDVVGGEFGKGWGGWLFLICGLGLERVVEITRTMQGWGALTTRHCFCEGGL